MCVDDYSSLKSCELRYKLLVYLFTIEKPICKGSFLYFFNLWMMTEMASLYLGKELQGDLGEELQFLKLSVVEDRLNTLGLCFTNTSSFGDKFILVPTYELNAK